MCTALSVMLWALRRIKPETMIEKINAYNLVLYIIISLKLKTERAYEADIIVI